MPNLAVVAETPISVYELKKELEKIKKRDSELNYRALKVEGSLNNSANASYAKKVEDILEKVLKMELPRVKDTHVKKLIDINPQSVNDVKVVMQGYTITLSNENMQKIVDIFKEFQ